MEAEGQLDEGRGGLGPGGLGIHVALGGFSLLR